MRGTPALVLLLAFCAARAGAESQSGIEELFSSSVAGKREEAARLLGQQGDTAAAKRLLQLAQDEDWGVRLEAYRALGPIRFGPGREALRNASIRGEIRHIRALAAEMLRDHDRKETAIWLARNLKRYKKEARFPLLSALGIVGGPEAIEALERQMRAPDPDHRVEAARALASLGEGEKGLTRGLKDRETKVRLLSLVGLSSIDTDSARAVVIGFLERRRDPWDGYLLRRVGRRSARANKEAITRLLVERLAKPRKPAALLQIARYGELEGCAEAARGQLKSRKPLVRAFAYKVVSLGSRPITMEEVEPGLRHKSRAVNHAAAEALLETSGRNLEVALAALLRHEKGDVVQVAIRKAVASRSTGILQELEAVARGKTPTRKDWQTRTAACVALGRLGRKAAFAPLRELAKSRDWWLRAAAIEGLYHTYETESIPVLIGYFDDTQPVVRMTTRRNLRYMTRKRYPTRKMYLSWWAKQGGTFEWLPPDERERRARKYGYAKEKYITEILRGTDIVVVRGRWDKVEKILEDLDVKHQAVRAQQIKDYGLSPKQVVLVNCEGSVDSRTTQYLQWFVCAGGYMATTDWSLVNALTKTFPGVVKGYVKQSTGNDVVIVEPGTPGHPTLAGVFKKGVDLKWWLEIQAFPIAIEDPVRATVLVDSMEMMLRYGSSVMMVEFAAGLGKVLHSTSHFYLQKEGFAHENDPRRRMIFAADHLGLSMKEIRELEAKAAFRDINNTTPISKSYSMFMMLVNFIDEKRTIDRTK